MGTLGAIIVIGLMIATTVVLIVGITVMARGGETNRKYGNKLMAARVTLQALAIAAVAVLLLMKK